MAKKWKRTATLNKKDSKTGRISVADQWQKGNSLVDLRKSGNNGFTLETFDMKNRKDNVKERFKSRSKGLKRARILMRRN